MTRLKIPELVFGPAPGCFLLVALIEIQQKDG
jgi:hypothetical protein